MKYIELSDDEIKVLLGMIDVFVRAEGLNGAANALHLARKLQEAEEPPEQDFAEE